MTRVSGSDCGQSVSDLVAVVGDDVHGRLLGGGGGAVDADVGADQLALGVLAVALVRVDQAAGALGADLAVVEVLVVLVRLGLGVRVRLLLLLRDPLLERLAGGLLVRRVAEPCPADQSSRGE